MCLLSFETQMNLQPWNGENKLNFIHKEWGRSLSGKIFEFLLLFTYHYLIWAFFSQKSLTWRHRGVKNQKSEIRNPFSHFNDQSKQILVRCYIKMRLQWRKKGKSLFRQNCKLIIFTFHFSIYSEEWSIYSFICPLNRNNICFIICGK